MRLSQACLLGFAVGASAWGQRGGPNGHSISAKTGGASGPGRSFSMSSPATPSGSFSAPSYRPNLQSSRYGSARPGYSSPIGPPPFGATQPLSGHRGPYSGNGSRRYYYSRGVYAVPGFLNYGFGYGDDSFSGDSDSSEGQRATADPNVQVFPPDDGSDSGPAGMPELADAPPLRRPAYQPPAGTDLGSDQPTNQPPIAVLFKDGRPEQQVQNYAITRTTLYILDGARRHEIPLSDIDLPGTAKANRDAGVDFAVPAGSR